MEWQPDLEFITSLEKAWTAGGMMDRPYGLTQGDRRVREIVDGLEDEGDTDFASYIRERFSLTQLLCDHHYTARECIQAMRDGNPFGVVVYLVLYTDHQESQLIAEECAQETL